MNWQQAAYDYKLLIENPEFDSQFLRQSGLIPNVVEMVGNCEDSVVLDAGTGTGWLFDFIKPKEPFSCDLNIPKEIPENVKFEIQDVQGVTYADDTFDIIVASLLLIYCERLDDVLREFFRIAKPKDGRLIISLMHPYFYRTGEVTEDGHFMVTCDLSKPFHKEFKIANQVGPFDYFYRPLPDYFNALRNAGWEVNNMKDWFIDIAEYEKLIDQGMRTDIARTGKVPMYTFIECIKP